MDTSDMLINVLFVKIDTLFFKVILSVLYAILAYFGQFRHL